jgi:hypothetical protein
MRTWGWPAGLVTGLPFPGGVRQDGCVRHATAVRRVRMIVDACQLAQDLWRVEPALVGAYVFGDVLEGAAEVPAVQMAFVLDLPAEDLAWFSRPPSCAGLQRLLEVDKAPMLWFWRSSRLPVANHYIQRPLRVWTPAGPDAAALDALAEGRAEGLREPAPTAEQASEQRAVELAVSLAHLRRVESGYWERDWRFAHRGNGVYPENHLWEAVSGYLDLLK